MKKVPNNPGIYYRLDKTGQKIYYLRLKRGTRQTWRKIGPRLKDAKDRWHKIKLGQVDEQLGVKVGRKALFHQVSAEYFEHYKSKAKERNWARVESIIRQLDKFFGRIEISKITLWTVENYIRRRRKFDKPSARTINLELDYLKAILNKAVDWNILSKAPKISSLPVQEGRARILSDQEIELVLAGVSEPHRDAIMLALDTGMRLGEIYRLRPENADMRADMIHLSETKNLKARSVPMTSRAKKILRRRFRKNKGRLFAYASVNSLGQKFGNERKRIEGVPPWRFHDLRHCFCTALLRKGVDPFTVMKLSGHSDIAMVTRYLHTDDDLKRAAIGKLEKIPSVTKKGLKSERPPGVTD